MLSLLVSNIIDLYFYSVFYKSSLLLRLIATAAVNLNLFDCFIVRLSDSILAFHKYGVQGRSLKNGEVTQEIIDKSRTYRLLGSDKYV